MRKHAPWILTLIALSAVVLAPPSAQVNVANNAAELSGKIIMLANGTIARTVTNAFTFDRDPSAPFVVTSGSAKVANLDADLLDGLDSTRLYPTTITTTTTGTVSSWTPGLTIGQTTLIRSNNATLLTINGIAGGVEGQLIEIVAIGNARVDIADGTALTDGILTGHSTLPLTLSPAAGVAPFHNGRVGMRYDATTARWRVLYHEQGAWLAYTTTWGNSGTANAIGNGTLSAAYRISGRTLMFRIGLTFGNTTTSGSGSWTFTFPTATVSAGANFPALIQDNGTALFVGAAQSTSTTILAPYSNNTAGITATSPMTWTTNDSLLINGTVEIP